MSSHHQPEPEPGWVFLEHPSPRILDGSASMTDATSRRDYENHELPHRNRLPARAYSVPSGERYVDLNGTWRFHFAATVLEAEQVNANPAAQWGKIEVPGMWQLQGHGTPWYTNAQFPFPTRPPLVPTENETGTYERSIYLKEAWLEQYRAVLRFDGVDSAFHVFVNGKEAGFSKGSRNAAEFDVSPLLKVGKNVIRVRVYRWSDGSYIEDQDQWWLSGIFRDVALLGYDKRASIVDFAVTTDFDQAYRDATLAIDLRCQLSAPVICKVRLLDVTGQTIVAAAHNIVIDKPQARLEYLIDAPTKWTAETPHLYTLQISLRSEDKVFDDIQQKVGFRKIEVKDGLVCINGAPIHFHGVNRHDHHAQFGRAVPLSFVREDLLLMKRHNINAVRTSHYPNHPRVLDMFDELGFYVIAECDLECHGFDDVSPRIRSATSRAATVSRRAPESWTSDNPEWREAYVERMRQLVHRDVNHPSIVFWSLGNESFFGANHRAMAAWARAHDSTRLIHYEPDRAAEVTDVCSFMYTCVADLVALAEQKDWTKPVILCEYAHAMGNGPGGLRDYQEVFRKHRRLQGGFVWEWANHGLAQKTATGVEYMAYGSDFDASPNDGTYCMDGLCDSNHKPTPGLVQLKNVFAPLKLERSGSKLKLTNYYDFLTLAHVECRWQFFRLSLTDRAKGMLQEGKLHIPELQAGDSVELDLPKTGPPRGDDEHILAFSFTTKEATAWAPAGHELAHVDFVTQPWRPPRSSSLARGASTPSVVEESLSYHVTTAKDGYVIDKRTGRLTSWLHGGRDLLCATSQQAGVKASFWRPPTDNDRYGDDADTWREHGLDRLRERLESLQVDKADDGAVTIVAQSSWAATSLTSRLDATTTYTITADTLTVKLKVEPAGTEQPATLPRRGLELLLDPGFTSIEWSGLGPGESYPDSREGSRLDLHRSTVDDLFYKYEVPQEAGNRHEARWLALRMPSGYFAPQTILRVHTRSPALLFDFNAARYTARAIEAAKHPHELKQTDGIVLHIDERVHGLGTASCGPGVLPQYRCENGAFELEVVLAAAPY